MKFQIYVGPLKCDDGEILNLRGELNLPVLPPIGTKVEFPEPNDWEEWEATVVDFWILRDGTLCLQFAESVDNETMMLAGTGEQNEMELRSAGWDVRRRPAS